MKCAPREEKIDFYGIKSFLHLAADEPGSKCAHREEKTDF
jgi:hypothetical protein